MQVFVWDDEDGEGNPRQRAFLFWVPASDIISVTRKNKIEIA